MPSPAVRPWLTCDLICSVLLDPLTQRCRRALRLACRHHPGALESPVPVHRVPSHRRVRGARCRKPGPSPWQLPLVPERDRPRPSSSPRGHWCFRSEHGAVDPSSLLQGPPCPDPRPVRSRRGVHGRRPLTDGAISAVGPFWRIERGDVRLGRHLDEIFGIRHRPQPALTPQDRNSYGWVTFALARTVCSTSSRTEREENTPSPQKRPITGCGGWPHGVPPLSQVRVATRQA